MPISGEQQRLEMLRNILSGHSFLPRSLGSLVNLTMNAEDADDCAVYDLPGNVSLVVGMDFIRGTGFTLFKEKYLAYYDIGYYLVIANLSDIAAMGATPIGLTTVVRYPDSLEDADFIEIIQGIQGAASQYETPIIGGDIGGYTEVVLAATALGIAENGKYFKRRGTVEGDALCITGYVGLPSTALAYFSRAKKKGFALSDEQEQLLLASWKRPIAQIQVGTTLAKLGVVHACQDVSDGGKATLDQLGHASHVSFEIYETHTPIHPITVNVAHFLEVDSTALALSASVDFQLMFTVSRSDLDKVQEALKPLPNCKLHVLGYAIPDTEPSYLVRRGGNITPIPGTPWDHQFKDVTKVILGEP